MIPTSISHRLANIRMNDFFAYLSLGIITVGLVTSLACCSFVCRARQDSPLLLLRVASALWLSQYSPFRGLVLAARWRRPESAR